MSDHFDVIIIGTGAGGGTLAYPRPNEVTRCRWTPRALKVLSTAHELAASSGHIEAADLLLAFESMALAYGDNVVSQALDRVGVRPSIALQCRAPESCPPNRYVSVADFGPSLSPAFSGLVIEEATAMGDDYVGIEHLLLFLARAGVPGVELPYECIRSAILELLAKS
jgi:hypothetical protein